MSNVIAKKYVKALVNSMDEKTLISTYESLESLIPAFGNKKFNNILSSSDVSNLKKGEFIISLLKSPDEKFTNFIKLLSSNRRLNEIPTITKELSNQIAKQNNQFEGVLISNFKVDKNDIVDIETNISKKLNTTIKLENKVSDYPGIKVEVESLGVEVSFSKDRLKAQMAEHILNTL